jgi:hypothetical protein
VRQTQQQVNSLSESLAWLADLLDVVQANGRGMDVEENGPRRAPRSPRSRPIDLAIDIRAVALVVSPAAGPGQDRCAATPRVRG